MQMSTGIWFGKLADGTEASISDVLLQEDNVVQAARVRLVNRNKPLDYEPTLRAAQYLRRRFPELNREEYHSIYKESRFERQMLSDEEASGLVKVQLSEEPSKTLEDCKEQAMKLMNKLIMLHPSSYSRLGWKIDVLYSLDGDDCVVWFIFSVAHTHTDGLGTHAILTAFMEAYTLLLNDGPLPHQEMSQLISVLPRDRIQFSSAQLFMNEAKGWLDSALFQFVLPKLKLPTKEAAKNAQKIQKERFASGTPQRAGPIHTDALEMDDESTRRLCSHARSVGVTVGSLVHSALFLVLANRYFKEHPSKQKLTLDFPQSINMRPFLNPPLPNTVLAPQQGALDNKLHTTRRVLDGAIGNRKAMAALLLKIAKDSRCQAQVIMKQPTSIIMAEDIEAASFFRHGGQKRLASLQYYGDAWFSNVGLYHPATEQQKLLKVETTFTLSKPMAPAAEMVWCNSTIDGTMALSGYADETMGRSKKSLGELLKETTFLLTELTL